MKWKKIQLKQISLSLKAPKWSFPRVSGGLGNIPVGVKIVSLLFFSVLIPLAIITAVTLEKFSQVYDGNMRDSMISAMENVQKDLEGKTKALKDSAIIISGSEQVRQALIQNDRLALNQYIIRTAGDMGLEQILVSGAVGKTLARSDKPSGGPEDISGSRSYKAAMAGSVDGVIDRDEGGLILTAYAPIKIKMGNREEIIGTILLKKRMKDRDLEGFGSDVLKLSIVKPGNGAVEEKTAAGPKTIQMKYTLHDRGGADKGTLVGTLDTNGFLKAKAEVLKSTVLLNLMIGLPMLMLGGVLAWSISRPLSKLKEGMLLAAAGDLTIASGMNSKDEIGMVSKAFDHMNENLSGLVGLIRENIQKADRTYSAAAGKNRQLTEEIRRMIEISAEIETSSQLQMEHLSEAAKGVSENMEGIRRVTEETDRITELAIGANRLVQENHALVDTKVELLRRLATDFEKTNEDLEHFAEEMERIVEIVELIKDFAQNTKLLAFNATIEAARAGEAGKGFAVVAKEITRLSQEVSGSIGTVEQTVRTLVAEMEADGEAVRTGVQSLRMLSKELDQSLEGMATAIQEVEEMSAGSAQISKILHSQLEEGEQVNKRVQEVSVGLQEFSRYSEALREMSGNTEKGIHSMANQMNLLLRNIKEADHATDKFKIA